MYSILNRTLFFIAAIIVKCNESIEHADYIIPNIKENQSIFFNLINKGTEVFSVLFKSPEERKIIKKEIYLYIKRVHVNIFKPENDNILKIYTFSKFHFIFLQNFIHQNINSLKEKLNENIFMKNIYLFFKLLEIRTHIDFFKTLIFSKFFRKLHVFLYRGIEKIYFFAIKLYKKFQFLNIHYEEIENNTEKVFFGVFLDILAIFYRFIDSDTKLNTPEQIQIHLEHLKYHIRTKTATFIYKNYIYFSDIISLKIFNFKHFFINLDNRISQHIDRNRIYFKNLFVKTYISLNNIISQQIDTNRIYLENLLKEVSIAFKDKKIDKLVVQKTLDTVKRILFYLKNILNNLYQTYKELKNISIKLNLKIKNSEYKIEINPLNSHFINQIKYKILKMFKKLNVFSIEISYEKENIEEKEIKEENKFS